MSATIVENSVVIPDGVTLNLEGRSVTVEGEKGRVARDFGHTRLDL